MEATAYLGYFFTTLLLLAATHTLHKCQSWVHPGQFSAICPVFSSEASVLTPCTFLISLATTFRSLSIFIAGLSFILFLVLYDTFHGLLVDLTPLFFHK